MLSLLFAYGWTLVCVGLAVGAFLTLTAPFRGPVVALLLMVVIADVGYTAGLSKGISQARAASEAYAAKLITRDFEITTVQRQLAEALQAAQEVQSDSDLKAAAYEKQLTESRSCPLSDGDRKRLLGIH